MEVERKLSFDEASLERSKSFVNALQELKNLRPQLYSAAEYCEKSYLHSEQKQMVLDNLKEYAMRALVNAVDHLGTVAYKLNDLLEQQTIDVNSVDLKLTSLNQKILTCQTYMDKEGARQQKLMAIVPRHHKRYTLPNSVSKKVHFGPNISADPGQVHVRARPRTTPSGSPSSKSLSWHLASGSESISSTKGTHKSSRSFEVQQSSPNPTSVFHLLDNEEDTQAKPSASAKQQQQPSNRNPSSSALVQPFGATYKDTSKGSRPITQFKSLDKPTRQQQQQQQIISAPPRSKSMISAFFVKQKAVKLKAGTVA